MSHLFSASTFSSPVLKEVGIKKDKIMSFVATWTELEGIMLMLAETGHKEKDKYCTVLLLTCGI